MKTASLLIAEQSGQLSDQSNTSKTRLLIISDSHESVSKLRAAFDVGEIEITCVGSSERLNRLQNREYDLAVVDVGPGQIAGVLQALRSKTGLAKLPVLVECGRISTEPGFDGLLPRYCAMPCCLSDMVRLVRDRTAPATSAKRERGIL